MLCVMDDASTAAGLICLLRSTGVGRKVDADDLVAAVEIAQRLGVARPQVVYDWRRRHPDFPEPVAQVGNVSVWAWTDVEAWAVKTGRL